MCSYSVYSFYFFPLALPVVELTDGVGGGRRGESGVGPAARVVLMVLVLVVCAVVAMRRGGRAETRVVVRVDAAALGVVERTFAYRHY